MSSEKDLSLIIGIFDKKAFRFCNFNQWTPIDLIEITKSITILAPKLANLIKFLVISIEIDEF